MKKKLVNFFLLLFCTSISVSVYAQTNIQDSLALVDLYNSTDGVNWNNNSNWLIGPVRIWYGITVRNSRVTQINLYYDNLSGSIPSSLANLTNLYVLILSNNQLGGIIPSFLSDLVNLGILDLSYNHLNGSIPSSLSDLSNLEDLNLSHNKLSGEIPYLEMPGTAHDTYQRSGRGYTFGRFKGPSYLCFETEYRFPILANRLVSGVCFFNFQTASDDHFKNVLDYWELAGGAGLRVLFDKKSRSALCLDFAQGRYGSWGIFCGLNEVF
jgi:hypothetical protein